MADRDRISEADRMELASLERTVSDAERMLLALPPGTRPLFSGFLHNAKARLGVLEKKIQDAEREQQEHARNEVALVVDAAQRETALNTKEKETYSGFLREDFFTKRDFARLEDFYAHTWDRLSEDGKDRMSHRIWEGVRRGEYKFGELPKAVREKETEHAYKRLTGSSIDLGSATRIPEKDRSDFIRAYESGDREGANEVLGRDSFKQSMFKGHESAARFHSSVDRGGEAGQASALAKLKATAASEKSVRTPEAAKRADLDLSAFGLDGVKMVDAASQGTSADIPNGITTGGPQRQSTRGG